MTTSQKQIIASSDAGQRLDAFLAGCLQIPRAAARRLLESGNVTLNGRPARKGAILAVGDSLLFSPMDDRIVANGEISILAEGEGWVIVDKPAGMPVHPLAPRETGTVLNALVARYPTIQGIGEGGLRSGVVHRLDVDTSGALLVATNEATWRRMRQAFKKHRARKLYRAIVEGKLKGSGREEVELVVGRHRPARVEVREGGVRCGLSWRAIETLRMATLLEISLETGFLHQIRATFANLGNPVVGDRTYNPGGVAATRQMLHASELKVEEATARSPDPADFREMLECLRE